MSDGLLTHGFNSIAVGRSPLARRLGSILHVAALVAASVFYFLIVLRFKGAIEAHLAGGGLGIALVISSKVIRDFLSGQKIIDVTRGSELRIYYVGVADEDIFRRWINFSMALVILIIGLVSGIILSVI